MGIVFEWSFMALRRFVFFLSYALVPEKKQCAIMMQGILSRRTKGRIRGKLYYWA